MSFKGFYKFNFKALSLCPYLFMPNVRFLKSYASKIYTKQIKKLQSSKFLLRRIKFVCHQFPLKIWATSTSHLKFKLSLTKTLVIEPTMSLHRTLWTVKPIRSSLLIFNWSKAWDTREWCLQRTISERYWFSR